MTLTKILTHNQLEAVAALKTQLRPNLDSKHETEKIVGKNCVSSSSYFTFIVDL